MQDVWIGLGGLGVQLALFFILFIVAMTWPMPAEEPKEEKKPEIYRGKPKKKAEKPKSKWACWRPYTLRKENE